MTSRCPKTWLRGPAVLALIDFGMAYTTVLGATRLNGNGIALLRNVLCAGATVPSGNASLLDNAGLEPVAVPPGICP